MNYYKDLYRGRFIGNSLECCTYTMNNSYMKESDFNALIAKRITTLSATDKVVYFDKRSAFPRFKMKANETLKRTIKVTNADVCVVPNETFNSVKNSVVGAIILKDLNKNRFILVDENDKYYLEYINKYNLSTTDDFINKVNSEGNLNVEFVDNDKFIGVEGHYTVYENIDNYKKVITDNDLDKSLGNSLPKITEEEISAIYDRLLSTGEGIAKTALKMLPNYDLSDYALTFKTMFRLVNIERNPMYKTSSVKQLISSLDFTPKSSSFPYSIAGLRKETPGASDADIKFAKSLITDNINRIIGKEVEDLKKLAATYGIEVRE